MPEPAPNPDVRSFEQLRDALLARIPVHAPEWADHDVSDPGVTLLELFAFLAENPFYLEEDSSDRASETLAAVRERLEGRLEYVEAEAQRGFDPLWQESKRSTHPGADAPAGDPGAWRTGRLDCSPPRERNSGRATSATASATKQSSRQRRPGARNGR